MSESIESSVTQKKDEDSAELATLEEYMSELFKRRKWRNSLRKSNLSAITSNSRLDESHLHSLDSSLKKNNAFVRKLKTFTESQSDSLIRDMNSLNLTKYIGEVASALVEAKLKMNDLRPVLNLCSMMHQKYAEFSQNLLISWQNALSLKKDQAKNASTDFNSSKMRVDIRFFSELIYVGILTSKDALTLLAHLLSTLVTSDKDGDGSFVNLPILTSFCRYCGTEYADLSYPRRIRILIEKHGYPVDSTAETLMNDFLNVDKRANVRNLLRDYLSSVISSAELLHQELAGVQKNNRRCIMARGEVRIEQQERVNTLKTKLEKLIHNGEIFADLFDENFPEFSLDAEQENEQPFPDMIQLGDLSNDSSNVKSIWEDEDEKYFYETLFDLPAYIPAILYKDSCVVEPPATVSSLSEEPESADNDQINVDPEDLEWLLKHNDLENTSSDLGDKNIQIEDDFESESGQQANSSKKIVCQAFLAKLSTCVNRDMIDKMASEFCLTLNNKISRKKLVRTLFSVHRNRLDLLPFYSRLVATLYPCMPEVAIKLNALLKQEFKWQIRKKDQTKIESKLKVCRFIGELVKFKMYPLNDVLLHIKQLLLDFSHHHIEMACVIIETCGRFLLRTNETHYRMKQCLEQMMRLKTAVSIDSRYTILIENAFYTANPTDGTVNETKAPCLPPLHAYIEKLLFEDLAKNTTEKVLKQIRKIDWSNEEDAKFVVKCLRSIWRVKFLNICYVADLLSGLVVYHDWVGIYVVDSILEEIRIGLEINQSNFNQRRIACIKFLGECYNYCLVDSSVIFKVLYLLITFGNSSSFGIVLDRPENVFRIRLICVLLETCRYYFNSKNGKKKLDYFITYFQRYYLDKFESSFWNETSSVFPMAVTNLYNETLFLLRPKLHMFKSLAEAQKACDKIDAEMLDIIRDKVGNNFPLEGLDPTFNLDLKTKSLATIREDDDPEEDMSEDNSSVESNNQHYERREVQMSEESEDEMSETAENAINNSVFGEEVKDLELHHDLTLKSNTVHECSPEDAEFCVSFERLLNEETRASSSLRSTGSSGLGQSLVPMVAPGHYKHMEAQKNDKSCSSSDPLSDTMKFSILVRKGTRPTYRSISVPMESDLARNIVKQSEAEKAEKLCVKELTLKINERQEEENMKDAIANLERCGISVVSKEKSSYLPPKGVPDTSLIFGNTTLGMK